MNINLLNKQNTDTISIIFFIENNINLNDKINFIKNNNNINYFKFHIFTIKSLSTQIKNLFNENNIYNNIKITYLTVININYILQSLFFWNEIKTKNNIIIEKFHSLLSINLHIFYDFIKKYKDKYYFFYSSDKSISYRNKFKMIECIKYTSKNNIIKYRKKNNLPTEYFENNFLLSQDIFFTNAFEYLGYNLLPNNIVDHIITKPKILFVDIMNIKYIPTTPFTKPLGGTQSSLCYFLLKLSQHNIYDIYLLNHNDKYENINNIKCIPIDTKNTNKIFNTILTIKPNIIISINSIEFLHNLNNLIKKYYKPKLICWIQDDINQKSALYLNKYPDYKKYMDYFIFISNWQKNIYIKEYRINIYDTYVIKNALSEFFINLFDPGVNNILKYKKPIIAYTSTPFRGLENLLFIFPKIKKILPEIELHVFSSMKVYQNSENTLYTDMYQKCKTLDGVFYKGSVSQNELSQFLKKTLIFAYPNIFRETYCISAAEAMAAGCYIITHDYGALDETTADFSTLIYNNNSSNLNNTFYNKFINTIVNVYNLYKKNDINLNNHLIKQINYVNNNYKYDIRAKEFINILNNDFKFNDSITQCIDFYNNHLYDKTISKIYSLIDKNIYNLDKLYHILGASYHKIGNYKKSSECYDRAIKINQFDSKYYTNNYQNFSTNINSISHHNIKSYFRKLIKYCKFNNIKCNNYIQSILNIIYTNYISLYEELLKITIQYDKYNPNYILRYILLVPNFTFDIKVSQQYYDNIITKAKFLLDNKFGYTTNPNYYNIYKTKYFYQNMYVHTIIEKNPKDINYLISKCYLKLWPKLNYINPNINLLKTKLKNNISNKIKIGFISDIFRNHSSTKLIRGLINNLYNYYSHKYEIYLFSLPNHSFNSMYLDDFDNTILEYSNDHITKDLIQHSKAYIKLNDNILDIQKNISQYDIDILIYTELGQSNSTYPLAFSRLAPIQCIHTWGHPITSGIKSSIDYTISMNIESDNANNYYTEKLYKFDNLTTYFYKPTISDPSCLKQYALNNNLDITEISVDIKYTKKDFNLPDDLFIYLCIQNTWKFNYHFIKTCIDIINKNKDSILVLLNNNSTSFKNEIKNFINNNYNLSLFQQIYFIDKLEHRKLLALINISDVVLDSFHWSGGITSFETFAFDKPLVTLKSNFLSGNLTFAMYKQMKIFDCIAFTYQEYVDIATKLKNNYSFRENIQNKILTNKNILYENINVITEWDKFFMYSINNL